MSNGTNQERGDAADEITRMRDALNMAAAALFTISAELRRQRNGDEQVAAFADQSGKAARNQAIPTRLRNA